MIVFITKLALVWLLLNTVHNVTCKKDEVISESIKIQAISNALISAIQTNSFIKIQPRLEFLIIDRKCEEFALKIIENVAKKCSNISSIQIDSIDESKMSEIPLKRQKIIFMESKLVQSTYEKFNMTNFDFLEEFHILITRKLFSKNGDFLWAGHGIVYGDDDFLTHIQCLCFHDLSRQVQAIGFIGVDKNCRFDFDKINSFNPIIENRWNKLSRVSFFPPTISPVSKYFIFIISIRFVKD